MTILYITTFYPTKSEPFRGHYVEKQAKGLTKKFEEDLVVLKLVYSKKIIIPRLEKVVNNGTTVFTLYYPNFLNKRSLLISAEKSFRFLLKKAKEYFYNLDISLTVSNDLWGTLMIGNIFKKFSGCKHVNIVHGETADSTIPSDILKKIEQELEKTDIIVAVSTKISRYINSLFNIDKDIVVNGNGIDQVLINRYKNFEFKKNSQLTIVSIGNLNFNKGFDIVLKALAGQENYFEYYIIGDGPNKRKLSNLIKKYNLEKNVFFTGNITNEEVFEYLEKSHLFILPSRNEAFGIVYLEAMLTKNIVIGTKEQGCEDFIKDGYNGYLVSSYVDIKVLLKEWEALYESDLINNGQETAKEYNWDRNISNLVNAIQKKTTPT